MKSELRVSFYPSQKSKVALDSGTHDSKTEKVEAFEIFNDQFSVILS